MKNKNTIRCVLATSYIVIFSVGCSPLAIGAHTVLNSVGVSNYIAESGVENRDSYSHLFIITNNGKIIDPRFLGLWEVSNIKYDKPTQTYLTVEEYYNSGGTMFPTLETIQNAIKENVIKWK